METKGRYCGLARATAASVREYDYEAFLVAFRILVYFQSTRTQYDMALCTESKYSVLCTESANCAEYRIL